MIYLDPNYPVIGVHSLFSPSKQVHVLETCASPAHSSVGSGHMIHERG